MTYDRGWKPLFINKIFHLRRLNRLAVRGMFPRGAALPPVRSSGIQHLTLKLWYGDLAFLARMLGAIIHLKSIDIEWDGDLLAGPIVSNVMFEQPINALRMLHATSLEQIVFDSSKAEFLDKLEDNTYPCGSFKEFTSLKYLKLPGDFLLGTARKAILGEDPRIAQHEYAEGLLTWAKDRMRKQDLLTDSDLVLDLDAQNFWEFVTDMFPAQLESLCIREYQGFMNSFGLREIWCNHFVCDKERRLPFLKQRS
jgi:hypothetical protein